MVAECELSLCRQASVLQPSHHVTLNTLQQLIYACIGMCAFLNKKTTICEGREGEGGGGEGEGGREGGGGGREGGWVGGREGGRERWCLVTVN